MDTLVQTAPKTPTQPFLSRRAVGVACLACIVSALVVGSGKATQNAAGVLYALSTGVFVVSLLVAYVGAAVLAVRAHSLLLLLVVFVIPVPPLGPLLCLVLTGAVTRPGQAPRGPRGGPRR